MKKLSILLFSWRDIRNPKKGGAEVFDFELLSRLVKSGHKVTWFAPEFKDGVKDELVDGIQIIRKGSFFSVHYEAIKFYEQNSGKFDIILDELHGYPFFTSLYIDKPKVTIIHEVASEIWFSMFSFPIAIVGFLFERIYFQLLKKQYFICPSPSTKGDLKSLGIDERMVFIAKEGSNAKPIKSLDIVKTKNQFFFAGGIRKMKGIPNLVIAMSHIVKNFPDAKLFLLGKVDHKYEKELHAQIESLQLQNSIIITGYVPQVERDRIMEESEYLLSCSIKEGFGLIVVEANALGTPAITFDVHGYRDIIEDGETGILVKEKTGEAFGTAVIAALKRNDYLKLQKNAWESSKQYNWETSAEHFEEILNEVMIKDNHRPSSLAKIVAKTILGSTYLFGKVMSFLKVV